MAVPVAILHDSHALRMTAQGGVAMNVGIDPLAYGAFRITALGHQSFGP
jgi:hypothetical protein